MLDNNCKDRELFADNLINEFRNGRCESYFFLGKNGTGKKYVIRKLKRVIEKNMRIFEVIDSDLFEMKQSLISRTISPEISINFKTFFAISLSSHKNEETKINYIISKLKSIVNKRNILIFATDFDSLTSECRAFLCLLLKHKELVETRIKTKISIVITGRYDYFNGKYNIKTIKFADYNLDDIKKYLIYTLSYKEQDITLDRLQQIQALCGTNYNLVNSYHQYIFSDDFKELQSIHELIERKIGCYIDLGKHFNLSDDELLATLLTSSVTIGPFSQNMVAAISHIDNKEKVSLCFKCAESEYFIEKTNSATQKLLQHYEFLSEDIKKHLFQLAVIEYKESILSSYLYVSNINEDNYFNRLQYLYQYSCQIDDAVFSLAILAVSKAFIINDSYSIDMIWNNLIHMNGDNKYINCMKIIIDAYKLHYNYEYSKSNDKLNSIDLIEWPTIIAAEIKRLKFRNGQLGHCMNVSELRILVEQLLSYIESDLYITSYSFYKKRENVFALSILYDIAPYALDSLNDKELFESIFDKSLVITNQLTGNNQNNTFAEYLINIFNRKAFLFRKPELALLNYEEAERFFCRNHITDQYAMTLSSKSGMLISIKKYSEAISACQKALDELRKENISIQGIEKIYNNLYIAQFLEFEQCHELTECISYAKTIAKKLIEILPTKSGGARHVILTNLSSFALYCNNFDLYMHYKNRIEESLGCKNVADVKDNSINDFYRYHFAWFDFYYFMHYKKWTVCASIVDELMDFYPAIFKNTKKMAARIIAARELINMKCCPNPRDFCVHFIKSTSIEKDNIDSRGLLLSDLQFTAWN